MQHIIFETQKPAAGEPSLGTTGQARCEHTLRSILLARAGAHRTSSALSSTMSTSWLGDSSCQPANEKSSSRAPGPAPGSGNPTAFATDTRSPSSSTSAAISQCSTDAASRSSLPARVQRRQSLPMRAWTAAPAACSCFQNCTAAVQRVCWAQKPLRGAGECRR